MTEEGEGRSALRGVELAWSRTGSGPSLIWGHGLHSSRADEDEFGLVDFAELGARCTVTRYDARGHGDSGYTSDPASYAWDELARDQLKLLDDLGIERYVACGASLGAATALHAAVLAPERVRGLVLVIPPTGWETRAAQTDMYETLAQVVEAKGIGPLLSGLGDRPVPDPLAGRDDWLERQVCSLERADLVRLAGRFRGAATANFPPREAVERIDVPALILAWTGDPGHPVTSAEELARLLPGSELKLASTWEEMGAWTAEIANFVSEVAAG